MRPWIHAAYMATAVIVALLLVHAAELSSRGWVEMAREMRLQREGK